MIFTVYSLIFGSIYPNHGKLLKITKNYTFKASNRGDVLNEVWTKLRSSVSITEKKKQTLL